MSTQYAGVARTNLSDELTPQARRAIWGAFIGFFVDNYDIFRPVIALAPAMAYFIPSTLSPTTAAVASAMIFAIGRWAPSYSGISLTRWAGSARQ